MYNYGSEWPELTNHAKGFTDYFFRLKELATSMFKWENLPKGVNPRYLEDALFYYGKVVFFKNKYTGNFVCLQCATRDLNVYGDPVYARPISPVINFDEVVVDEYGYENDINRNGVLIRNTFDDFPTAFTTLRYTQALWDLDETRDVNLKAQKTPVLVMCDQQSRNTLENLYKKFQGNTPVIYARKDVINTDSLRVLKTDAPFVAGQVQNMKLAIWNEYLNFLGIGKPDFVKKERLVTDEVEQTEVESNAMANIMLAPRQMACERINELFGLDISVNLRSEQDGYNPEYDMSQQSVRYMGMKAAKVEEGV